MIEVSAISPADDEDNGDDNEKENINDMCGFLHYCHFLKEISH